MLRIIDNILSCLSLFSITIFVTTTTTKTHVVVVHASKNVRNSDVTTQYTKNNHRQQQQRRDQLFVCSAPPGGCNFGLWNENSCECNCIPPYCTSDIFPSCATPGTCSNSFEGCTPHINCPYFPNPNTGLCESGSSITPGIFKVFRTLEECCRESFSQDASSCIQAPPIVSSSSSQSSQQQQSSVAPDSTVTGADAAPLIMDNTAMVPLTPIPIVLRNLPFQFKLDIDRRGKMITILQNTLTPTGDEFNITILEIDIVENLFSNNQATRTLPLELLITITGTRRRDYIFPGQIHAAFLDVLQDRIYEIVTELRTEWGSSGSSVAFTNSVVLGVGDVQTTSAPTLRPALAARPSRYGEFAAASPIHPNYNNNNDDDANDGGKISMPIWAAVLLAILLTMLCLGLLMWQRRREKTMDGPQPVNDISFYQGGGRGGGGASSSSSSGSISKMTTHNDGVGGEQERALAITRLPPGSVHVDPDLNRSHQSFYSLRSNPNMDGSLTISRLMNQSSSNRSSRMSRSIRSKGMSGRSTSRSDRSMMDQGSVRSSSNQSRHRRRDPDDEDINRGKPDPPERIHGQLYVVDEVDHSSSFEDVSRGGGGDQGQISLEGEEFIEEFEDEFIEELEEELEKGYEGGKSSFFTPATHEPEDSSDQDEDIEMDESEDNVLGLLYYAGASSAEEESDAKESKKSRRSGRSKSTTGRHSSGKSAKTKSSRSKSQKSRRKKKTAKKVAEEFDYQQQQQQQQQRRHPQAFSENIVNKSEMQHTTRAANPMADSLDFSGSEVYIDMMSSQTSLTPENNFMPTKKHTRAPRGDQSTVSHGSTIRTNDNHRMAFAQNESSSRKHEHALSLDSFD